MDVSTRRLLVGGIVVFLLMDSAACHHCGIGPLSTFASVVLTKGCKSEQLSDECCLVHDECYSRADLEEYLFDRNDAKSSCDQKFKDCIWQLQADNKYCRGLIYVTHGILAEYTTRFCQFFGNAFC